MKINRAGQMMMLAVLILFTLVIVVPVLIFVTSGATTHSVFSFRKSKGRQLADEGVALALQQLARQPNPPGTPPPNWPYDPGGGGGLPQSGIITSPEGGRYGRYLLNYSSVTPGVGVNKIQPDQVGVTVQALDDKDQPISASAVFVTVSKRTNGIRLPNGYSAPAALELNKIPNVQAGSLLRVEWGPIVVRDKDNWELDNYMKETKRPRKFAAAGMSPRNSLSFGRTTDHKEYWTYASPGFQTVIKELEYRTLAKDTTKSVCGVPWCMPADAACGAADPAGSCYFNVPVTQTAQFSNTTTVSDGGTIYVRGNAKFFDVNFSSASAIYVTGNLHLGENLRPPDWIDPDTDVPLHFDLPATAALDDPYCSCCDLICTGTVNRYWNLGGFVYVGHELTVSDKSHWTLYGAMRVDGGANEGEKGLTVETESSLFVLYNEKTKNKISTANFEVQIDSMTVVR